MNRFEVAVLLSYMNHVWANAKESSTEALDVWTGLLEDLPFPAVQQAVRNLAMTRGPFAPSPWEIRQAAMAVHSLLAIEAHDQAIKAIGTLYVFSDGWRCEGLKEMHPLARRALELFGVREFANANPEFARPQYMKIYEQLVKRAEEDALLPAGGRRPGERQALPSLPLREAIGGLLREAQRPPRQLVQGVHDLHQPQREGNRLPQGGVEEAGQEELRCWRMEGKCAKPRRLCCPWLAKVWE
ncbi:MAG: replicative helicase loader/inhibitor [Coprothermobacterota bacterium]|nr:replicative helicase loader/inhibitor [Coprothermobacterota bacterium]